MEPIPRATLDVLREAADHDTKRKAGRPPTNDAAASWCVAMRRVIALEHNTLLNLKHAEILCEALCPIDQKSAVYSTLRKRVPIVAAATERLTWSDVATTKDPLRHVIDPFVRAQLPEAVELLRQAGVITFAPAPVAPPAPEPDGMTPVIDDDAPADAPADVPMIEYLLAAAAADAPADVPLPQPVPQANPKPWWVPSPLTVGELFDAVQRHPTVTAADMTDLMGKLLTVPDVEKRHTYLNLLHVNLHDGVAFAAAVRALHF